MKKIFCNVSLISLENVLQRNLCVYQSAQKKKSGYVTVAPRNSPFRFFLFHVLLFQLHQQLINLIFLLTLQF